MANRESQQLFRAVVAVLVPVVRFCLRRGLRIQEIYEALKIAIIDAAAQDLSASGSEVNISRLAAATGMHRRDVMRLSVPDAPPKEQGNLLMRIIGQWQTDPRFRSKRGPKVLSLDDSTEDSFPVLVRALSQDLNSSTLLFELERIGAVERTGTDSVRLIAEAYEPLEGDAQEGMRLLARDLDGLTRAVELNIFERQDPPNLHIATIYDNVVVDKVPEIRNWFLEYGTKIHKEVREFLAKYDRDINKSLASKSGDAKATFGTFGLVETHDLSETKKPKG